VKRLPLAVLLAFGALAFARADEGAYKSLVGMARTAATDRGPDAEDAAERASTGTDVLKDALADVPAPRARAAAPSRAAPKADAGAAAPAPPPAAVPRLWTRLYATLLPSWRHPYSLAGAFEPASSTGPVRARMTPLPALMPPPASEAVAAGERRGLAELMSVSSPTDAR
jgi:hypothetical protein